MKKILSLYLFLLIPICLFSQIEVRGGLGSSTLTNYLASSRLSYHFGVMYGFNIDDNFSVEPGLLFSKEGAHHAQYFYNLSLSYIELPVLAKYTISNGFIKGFSLKTGPYIAYGISGSRDNESGSSDKQNIKFDAENRIDLGMQFEVSYRIKKINIYTNYKKGLRGYDNYYEDRSAKISNLRFGVGYIF